MGCGTSYTYTDYTKGADNCGSGEYAHSSHALQCFCHESGCNAPGAYFKPEEFRPPPDMTLIRHLRQMYDAQMSYLENILMYVD